MRARFALAIADIAYEAIEVDLKNKPEQLLLLSPKGTVPVLVLNDGRVLEQSLDIMYWALQQSEIHNVLLQDQDYAVLSHELIQQNDSEFKRAIDCYKYPNKYSADDVFMAKSSASKILAQWNALLTTTPYFCGNEASLVDYALMPFVRQFAGVDSSYFAKLAIPNIHSWLVNICESELFVKIMRKA
jgi:glutathione S-transferase